jgi:diguanylate cyclase (GGDEF)-like protein
LSESAYRNPLHLNLRLGVLQLARLVIAGLIAVAATVSPERFELTAATVAGTAVAYAVATTALEVVRRTSRLRLVPLASTLLVVDALLVSFVSAHDTGPTGPLSFLPVLHVVAVGLLAGPMSGLRIAAAHVVLLFAALVRHTADGALRASPSAYALGAVGTLSVAVVLAVIDGAVDRSHRRRSDQLAALTRFAERCQEMPSAAGIVDTFVEQVVDAFDLERGAVALGGVGEDDRGDEGRLQLLRRLGAEHEPLRATLGDPTNVVWVPLHGGGGHRIGVAAFVAGDRPRGMPGEDVELIERFCAHAALAIGNAQLRAEVERLATTDPLTGLPNRRRFEEALAAEVSRSRRHRVPFAVVAVDVDHFKAVNDTHGHAAGDEVLVAVADALRGQCRVADVAARTGGEEFVVLLPATDLSDALVAAERIRGAVASESRSTPIPVTVSVGVAAFPETSTDAQRLLVAADDALYRAKAQGRDRVCAAGGSRRRPPLRAVRASS